MPADTTLQAAQHKGVERRRAHSLRVASHGAMQLCISAARQAQRGWHARSIRDRLRILRAFRHAVAEAPTALARLASQPGRSDAETIAAEVLPMLDACRYLEKKTPALLAGKTRRRGRPWWLVGKHLRVMREPIGTVLIVGPSNYKLMLAGIQTLQALAAGNAVVLKPGAGAKPALEYMQQALRQAGVPAGLVQVLDERPDCVHQALHAGVDQVVFTGSAEAGRAVGTTAATTGTPTIMELSGCDAAVICEDANIPLAAEALVYGLRFNAGDTCMSPKRVFVHQSRYDELIDTLRSRLSAAGRIEADTARLEQAMQLIDEAEHQGATLLTRRPAGSAWHPAVVGEAQPSMAVMQQPASLPMLAIAHHDDDHQASELVNQCPYGLGATIFTTSRQRAEALAGQIDVGFILVNDMIVPTADPRLPFEPRRQSGHGVTRGNEGLLAMTRAKAIIHSRGRRRPYWRRLDNGDTPTVADAIQLLHHRRWLTRIRALRHMLTRTSKTDR